VPLVSISGDATGCDLKEMTRAIVITVVYKIDGKMWRSRWEMWILLFYKASEQSENALIGHGRSKIQQ